MYFDEIPINDFVLSYLETKEMNHLIGDWPFEPQDIAKMIVKDLKELGIFRVSRNTHLMVMDAVEWHIRHNKKIETMVTREKARAAEKRRGRSMGD